MVLQKLVDGSWKIGEQRVEADYPGKMQQLDVIPPLG
jgi:hypothetical protein